MRYCRAECHVARADQLDRALIGSAPGRRSKRTCERKSDEFRIVRIGRDFNNVPVQNDDLSLLKLACGDRRTERQPIRLIFCVHRSETSAPLKRVAKELVARLRS